MQISHQSTFGLAAGFPAQIKRGHQVAELFAIEDHALEDPIHKGLQGGGGEAVLGSDAGEFGGVFLCLEASVALADGGFVEAFARLQGADVLGDVLALVHELGIRLNQADELPAAHLLLAWPLLREA